MQADHIQRREPSPARKDEIIEAAVLTQVIALHPAQLTILELALRMEGECEDFAARDAVARAVRELSRDGLLHCDCRRIWPSRAALRFDALLGGIV
jgi:hypothetical protein